MILKVCMRLITPAMIGGAEARNCDFPPVLRPPAVRGMLRFWTRALGGSNYRQLESALWGSTDTGQGIRIVCASGMHTPSDHVLFPHQSGKKRSKTPMSHPDNSILQIGFRVEDRSLLDRLRAVVWTWLHLGSIGRRARRGYGSLLWIPSPGDREDLLSDFVVFAHKESLSSPDALAAYLKEGLAKVRSILGGPHGSDPRKSHSWFTLETVDQVFVGRKLAARYDEKLGGMECLIHGLKEAKRSTVPNEGLQMGRALGGRQASPMMWRLFRAADGGYIPVMTWSPLNRVTKISATSGMYQYLNGDLGFDKSLGGLPLA